MFRNKHVIIALLVAPVLAILAWFAVGALVGEEPHQAVAGSSYPLLERSNCRYGSGQCDLRNEDMRLSIVYEESVAGPILRLQANQSLSNALLGVGVLDTEVAPLPMQKQDSGGMQWTVSLPALPSPSERLMVVVEAQGARWYADTSTAFLERYRAGASRE